MAKQSPRGGRSSRAPRSAARGRAPAPAARAGAVTIVGVGASAGGLQALEQFLRAAPAGHGVAYVIVQHLDPTRQGIMPDLLSRATAMPVAQVEDRTRVEPDHVYVIPPNKDLSILRGVLHLLDPTTPRGLRLPIDFFLRALADDQGARSVGVILSGMGTDGTLGLKAVKERGGVVLVQEPGTAGFDGMPRSAIDTGLADVVAPAEELAGRLVAFLEHRPRGGALEPARPRRGQAGIEKIVLMLRSRTGHDFSEYKRSTLDRRIARRMALHQLDAVGSYVRYLQENPQEQDLLFDELLIGVTSFFRDPESWEALGEKVFPALFAARPAGGLLRAWVAACSTGEEAYSLAMVFKDALEEARPKASFSLQVFATDLDRAAIEKARQGVYPANIASDVSPRRLRRHFAKGESGAYRIGKDIREMVILAPHDVIKDPPFTRLDLLVCRNLLIYLESDLQRRLLTLFHYCLNPGGVLFLGASEAVGGLGALFTPIDAKRRLYRRKDSAARAAPVRATWPPAGAPGRAVPQAEAAGGAPNLQAAADELVLRQLAPVAVLVTDQGDVVYTSGRAGRYLEPAAGKANWNIFAMARDGLRYALVSAVQKAVRRGRSVVVRDLKMAGLDATERVDLTVRKLQEPAALRGLVLVVFGEGPPPPAASRAGRRGQRAVSRAEATELQREVRQLQEELRRTSEDMQASQEELRSANEELQSTNEELQSTNEELTTSREELQSMNEELQTVNGELQARVEELSRASNDMRNLLDSTHVATLFLDRSLRLRRFTAQATRLLRLIPGDVGREVTDLASDLVYPLLGEDVERVLRTLASSEREIASRDGRWFMARAMPYRTLDEAIDGVVITFADITAAKVLEAELRRSRERFSRLVGHLPAGVALLDEAGRPIARVAVLARIGEATDEAFAAWRVVLAGDGPGEGTPP